MLHVLRFRKKVKIFLQIVLFLFFFYTGTEILKEYLSYYKQLNIDIDDNNYWNIWNSKTNHVKTSTFNSFYVYAQSNSRSIFEKWRMNKKEKLEYKINYNIGLNIDAEIGDFGDYNADIKTDLFLYKYDESKLVSYIYVYIFDVKENKFTYYCETFLQGKIKNLVAVDWNFDGLLDILVLFSDVSGNAENIYYLSAFIQNEDAKLVEIWNSKKKEKAKEKIAAKDDIPSFYYTNIHPLVFDINNDGYPDLICQQSESNKFVRFVWLNDKKNGFKSILWENFTNFEYEVKNKKKEDVKKIGEISNPHSSAIVDVNGDCKSDLVFTVYKDKENISLEIWINTISKGIGVYRKLETNYDLPPSSLQILYGDFNADGSIDLIVPTCQKSRSCNNCCVKNDKIYFIPNIQKKLCDNTWTKMDQTHCRPAHNLCSESDFEFLSPVTEDYVSIIDENNNLHFAGDDEHPQYISVGDIDSDGYLDFLITLKSNDENKYVRIYKNELKAYNDEKNVEIRNFFNFYQFIMSSNDSDTRNIYNSAFFDIFENGTLDILIFGKYSNSKTSESKYTAVAFVRTNETDSLFLKATSLNGTCVNNCYKNGQSQLGDISTTNSTGNGGGTNQKYIGANVNGPTFKITVIDINGVKTSRTGVQRSQSSHAPLQLPFLIFGLGRTSNYVEEFYLGMPTQEVKYYNVWVSIIPNSHIIIIPYPLNNSNEWKIQLSVNPSNKIYSIMYITMICLLIIGFLIFILDRKEKIEDMKEERGFKSHFVIG